MKKGNAQKERRDKEQRIRGPKLAVLVARRTSYGLPFEEGLLKADRENRVIVSNKRMDQALIGSEEWKSAKDGQPGWTGTMTGYTQPGERLGDTVEYVDPKTNIRWVFPVPQSFRGEKDCVLVVEHPDFTLERDGNTRIVNAAKVGLVERFPPVDGWYDKDSSYGIPSGDKVKPSEQAVCLSRTDTRVAPVVRGNADYDVRQLVGLFSKPSTGLGMIVEAK